MKYISTETPATVHNYLKEKVALIETTLEALINKNSDPKNRLYEAALYSLLAGGKRLRPILGMAVADAYEANTGKGLHALCSLEMIHTYSLIHDDLPCMDDDDLRRGKPTLHKMYPEAHALLTGDFLLTYAFEVIATDDTLSLQQRLQMVRCLAHHAGGEGMILGQLLDLEAERKAISLEALQEIHSKKTGALMIASLEFGAIIAEADDRALALLRKFGADIGLAYQIVDDILDVTSSEDLMGKSYGSDLLKEKATYVSLMGLEKARKTAQSLLTEAEKTLMELPIDSTLLRDLAKLLVNRDR